MAQRSGTLLGLHEVGVEKIIDDLPTNQEKKLKFNAAPEKVVYCEC